MSKANNGANLGFERELWQAADAIVGYHRAPVSSSPTRYDPAPIRFHGIR